ncbi:MAG: SRPBCC domain-containing protein [Iphinoe sp. HA4291-MV1]|jgi:uncharacterized protein YndB with AHSA1/START domain|nr:SRPBCC domain-containing protein [Iphinoe sp. HA4291-MV1]
MLRDLKKEVFYPHPPQKVWQVLTNRRALAAWLMKNDFEPRVGHKFQFQDSTLPGLDESIDCEVIELDEPKRLSYTWQDKFMSKPSIVTWVLEPQEGGTQLRLEHRILETAVTESRESWQSQFMYEQPTASALYRKPLALQTTLSTTHQLHRKVNIANSTLDSLALQIKPAYAGCLDTEFEVSTMSGTDLQSLDYWSRGTELIASNSIILISYLCDRWEHKLEYILPQLLAQGN